MSVLLLSISMFPKYFVINSQQVGNCKIWWGTL